MIEDVLDQYERHMQFLHLNRMEPGHINMPDSPEQPPADPRRLVPLRRQSCPGLAAFS